MTVTRWYVSSTTCSVTPGCAASTPPRACVTRSLCASKGSNSTRVASERRSIFTSVSPVAATRSASVGSGAAEATARYRPSRENASAVIPSEAHPSSVATRSRVSTWCT